MHKGRRCPRFLETWLTITSHVDTFAPRQLNAGFFFFNGGASFFIVPHGMSAEGIVNVDDQTITWLCSGTLVDPGDCLCTIVMTFDEARGANTFLINIDGPGGVIAVECEADYNWEAWNDTAVVSITRWEFLGTLHTDGGTMTSAAMPWF